MLKKSLFLLLCIFSMTVFAQQSLNENYAKQWAIANTFIEEQLPESAMKMLQNIYLQAEKEANETQMLKAKMSIFSVEISKDAERTPVLLSDFEQHISKISDKALQAIAYNLLAEMYFQIFENARWEISERTNLVDVLPADINEWSKQHFANKVLLCLQKSFEHSQLLLQTKALQYSDLMLEGEDSRTLQPTVYDLLLDRTLALLQDDLFAKGTYDARLFSVYNEFVSYVDGLDAKTDVQVWPLQLLAQRLKMGASNSNANAHLYADIKRLNYVKTLLDDKEAYANALTHLAIKYADNPLVVEVLYLQVQALLESNNHENVIKAHAICQSAITKFSEYSRISILKNIVLLIESSTMQMTNNDIVARNKALEIELEHKNIQNVKINVYRINDDMLTFHNSQSNRHNDTTSLKRAYLKTYNFSLNKKRAFEVANTKINLPTPEFGIFEIEVLDAKTDSVLTKQYYRVTDMSLLTHRSDEKTMEVAVLHRVSGRPVSNALVKVYNNVWTGGAYQIVYITEHTTDKNGFASIELPENHANYVFFVSNANDKAFSNENYSYYYRQRYFDNVAVERVNVFSDRAIYRPGQMLYFKAIAYSYGRENNVVLPNKKLDVKLFDANYKLISEQKLTTNEFGSIVGEFVLPKTGLNGQYRLRVGETTHSFFVEEYKRPLFEIRVEKPEDEVRFDEKITLKGKAIAYAGYAIANAKVSYRWQRMRHPFAFWMPRDTEWLEASSATTDADGVFEFEFSPTKPNETNIWSRHGAYYNYQLTVDITDEKGETQTTTQTIAVGDKALMIVADIPSKINKNKVLQLDVKCETLNGIALNQSMNYAVYTLVSNDYFENIALDSLKNGKQISAGKFVSGKEKFSLDAHKWKSGAYRIEISTTDKYGQEVKIHYNTIIYSENDRRPPLKTYLWVNNERDTYSIGENVEFVVGSAAKNAWILYEVFAGEKQIEKKWLRLSNRTKKFSIPFTKAMADGATICLSMVRDEKVLSKMIVLSEKTLPKALTPKLTVFRDKLQPGNTEEWTINIPESKSKMAELMTVMYDASLDAISKHEWQFAPNYRPNPIFMNNWNAKLFENQISQASFELNFLEVKSFAFDALLCVQMTNSGMGSGIRPMQRRKSFMPEIVEEFSLMAVDSAPIMIRGINIVEDEIVSFQKVETTATINKTAIRNNFAETAFFYPQLKTDAEGNVQLRFVAPQSLTRWNVKMLAHTPDLFVGYAENSVVTQKELMLNLHLPRFVRQSDKWELAASVVNMTDSALQVSVLPEVLDTRTGKTIEGLMLQVKQIELAPKASQTVSWEMPEMQNVDLLVCKMVASSQQFSDGEQRYLPVLPNKVLVTETMPMLVRSNQSKTFVFDSMKKQFDAVDNKTFTLEFTSNPVCHAIQALPALSVGDGNSTFDLLSRYYASQMAHNIVSEMPEITQQLQKWQNKIGDNDALQSNLEKNEELKNIVLEQTPWVMAAKNESEQMHKLIELLNVNRQTEMQQQLLDRLLKNQYSNGAFSWMPDMQASVYVTLEFLMQVGKLKSVTGIQLSTELSQATQKALTYVDAEMKRAYDDFKKQKEPKTLHIGSEQIKYLYVRTLFAEIAIDKTCIEAYAYYLSQSFEQWKKQSLYNKAMIVNIAQANNKGVLANQILRSLREQAIKSTDKGMFWAGNRAGYFWNERPVVVQTALIEAFSSSKTYAADVDEMKVWLLLQKQTQMWDSPIATVNAVSALMQKGSNWLTDGNSVQVRVANKVIERKAETKELGYFKEQFQGPNISREMADIKVESHNKAAKTLSWGAAYWQYMVSPNKMQKTGAGLHVSKQLFVLQTQNAGVPSMKPLSGSTLRKGDRIVTRLVVTADRNFEFVALNDHRAACLEPVDKLSGMQWKQGVSYYQSTKDASTDLFFTYLPKGTYVFEYEANITHEGQFDGGRAALQCLYAPEFVAHCGSEMLVVSSISE